MTELLGDVPPAPVGGSAFLRRDLPVRLAQEEALAAAATRSLASRGRRRDEPPDAYRTPFEVDRDRVLHSKAFRRLKHKTQVFPGGSGVGLNDHVVTRLTHTLQVTQVARALAAGLGLNQPLTEAVALGHDVGHAPFGHVGEDVLDRIVPGGWHHAAQGVRVYEVLEDRNLTWEVRDGIRGHSWRVEPAPATPEARCVRFADRIAYLLHDALDAVRAGVLAARDLPAGVVATLGQPGGRWIAQLVEGVIDESCATGDVAIAPHLAQVIDELRDFLFARVYRSSRSDADRVLAEAVVGGLVDHHLAHPEQLPRSYRDGSADPIVQTVDYVAGMTDRYALGLHRRLFGTEPTARLGAER